MVQTENDEGTSAGGSSARCERSHDNTSSSRGLKETGKNQILSIGKKLFSNLLSSPKENPQLTPTDLKEQIVASSSDETSDNRFTQVDQSKKSDKIGSISFISESALDAAGSTNSRYTSPNGAETDENSKTQLLNLNSKDINKNRYTDLIKGQGNHCGGGLRQTLHGTLYQLRLCTLYFLYALRLPNNLEFGLASEHKDVQKYDDVVYKVHAKRKTDTTYHFIQAKHVQNPEKKEIKANDLSGSSNNNWGDRLMLKKYFSAYRQIKRIPGIDSSKCIFIICTNAGLDVDDLEKHDIKVKEENNHDFLTILGGSSGKCYGIKPTVTSDLYKKMTEINSNQQSNAKSLIIISKDVEMFLSELILAVNLPNENQLENMIKEQIQKRYNIIDSDLMADGLQNKMIAWLNKRTGEWINRDDGLKFMEDIKPKEDLLKSIGMSLQYIKKLSKTKIYLSKNNLVPIIKSFLENPQNHLLQIVTDNKYSYLTEIKIFQAIQLLSKTDIFQNISTTDYSAIYVEYTSFIDSDCIANAFQSEADFNLLTLINNTENSLDINLSKLFETCINKTNKKVIIIVNKQVDQNKLQTQFPKLEIKEAIDDGFTFRELTENSQMLLLQMNIVNLQESIEKKSIASMFVSEDTTESLKKIKNIAEEIIDRNAIITFTKGKGEIEVGRNTRDSNVMSEIYIERRLKNIPNNSIQQTSSDIETPISETIKNDILEEKDLLKGDSGRVIVVVNDAGSGKSTLVNSLCKKIRAMYPSSWICRIDLNNYAKVFNEIRKEETISDPVEFMTKKLLGSLEETKLETAFEERLFKLGFEGYIRLYLLFDGFDEICPDYQEVVVQLLSTLQKTKVEKLLVTTREEEGKFLKKHFEGVKYSILPLSQEEQRWFLCQYWAKQLGKDPAEVEDWLIYRNIYDIGRKAGNRTNLANPLTLVMVAECWRDIVYSSNNLEIDGKFIITSLDKLDFRYLHKYFVDRKFEIYAKEKSKICEGNIGSNNMFKYFIKNIQNVHRHLAMAEILDENIAISIKGGSLNIDEELKTALLKIGIVRQTGSRFNFVHRTFGEYLVIEFIISNYDKVKSFLNSKEWREFMKSVGYKRTEELYQRLINSRFDILEDDKLEKSELPVNSHLRINMIKIHGSLALAEWCGQQLTEYIIGHSLKFDDVTIERIRRIGLVEEIDGEYKFIVKWIFIKMKEDFVNVYIKGFMVRHVIKEKLYCYTKENRKTYQKCISFVKFYNINNQIKKIVDIHSYIAIEQRYGKQTATELFGRELFIDEPMKEELLKIGLIGEREWWGRLVFSNYWITEYFIYNYFKSNPDSIKNVTDVWNKKLLTDYLNRNRVFAI